MQTGAGQKLWREVTQLLFLSLSGLRHWDSDLDPPTSVSNQENASQICPQGDLSEAVSCGCPPRPPPPLLKFSRVTLGYIRLLAEAAEERHLFGSPLSRPQHHGKLGGEGMSENKKLETNLSDSASVVTHSRRPAFLPGRSLFPFPRVLSL